MSAILVVDDDPIHAEYLVTLLQRSGEAADCALSARDALQHLAGGRYGIVITDLLMPDVDGIELVREIRRSHPHIGIIGVSGCDGALRRLAGALMAHYGLGSMLAKPIDQVALRKALNDSRESNLCRGL